MGEFARLPKADKDVFVEETDNRIISYPVLLQLMDLSVVVMGRSNYFERIR